MINVVEFTYLHATLTVCSTFTEAITFTFMGLLPGLALKGQQRSTRNEFPTRTSDFGNSRNHPPTSNMAAHCQSVLTRGRRTPHMKGVGMLVVSLRGVHFGFWSHLG